jgi:putative transcriptional regulator
MSVTTRKPKISRAGRPRGEAVGPRLIAGMKELDDWVGSGQPLESRFTVRTIRDIPEPTRYSARRIAGLCRRLGASQTVFAKLIGTSPALIRAWEIGGREPSTMARRLLDQIAKNTETWQSILRRAAEGRQKGT